MKRLKITGLIILTTITINFGQNLDTLKLDNKLSILNDIAFFDFPTNAKNLARSGGLMSADKNINRETRILLDIGDQRLVFFALELYQLNDDNVLTEASKRIGNEYTCNSKILSNKDNLFSILSTPTKFDSTQGAILVNSLLVRNKDNSLFRIDAYINPQAFKSKDGYIKLSEQVFKTLSLGTRVNDRKAREEEYGIYGSKKKFKFALPENYSVTVDQKYDFQVFNFHKYSSFSDTTIVDLTIYTGQHPSSLYREFKLDKNSATITKGTFLKKKIDWLTFKESSRNIYIKERQIPSDEIEKNLIVHVSMYSNKQVSIDDLSKIVESIKLTK